MLAAALLGAVFVLAGPALGAGAELLDCDASAEETAGSLGSLDTGEVEECLPSDDEPLLPTGDPSPTPVGESGEEDGQTKEPRSEPAGEPAGDDGGDETSAGTHPAGADDGSDDGEAGTPAPEEVVARAAGPAAAVVLTAERAATLAAPFAIPISLGGIAIVLIAAAIRGPGRLSKLEDDPDGAVYRL